MQVKPGHSIFWDSIGITTSFLCAVHCVMLPLFLTSLSFFGFEVLENNVIETATILISFSIGSWAFWTGYRKKHRNIRPALLFAGGFVSVLAANLFFKSGRGESGLKLLGAGSIIAAHISNVRYCKHCTTVSKPDLIPAKHLQHRQKRIAHSKRKVKFNQGCQAPGVDSNTS